MWLKRILWLSQHLGFPRSSHACPAWLKKWLCSLEKIFSAYSFCTRQFMVWRNSENPGCKLSLRNDFSVVKCNQVLVKLFSSLGSWYLEKEKRQNLSKASFCSFCCIVQSKGLCLVSRHHVCVGSNMNDKIEIVQAFIKRIGQE